MSHPSPAKIYHYTSRVSVFIFLFGNQSFCSYGCTFCNCYTSVCFHALSVLGVMVWLPSWTPKIPHNHSLCSVFILPYWYFSINVWLKYCGFCKNFLIHFFSLYISIGQRSSKSIGFRNHVVLFWRRALAKYQSVEK